MALLVQVLIVLALLGIAVWLAYSIAGKLEPYLPAAWRLG